MQKVHLTISVQVGDTNQGTHNPFPFACLWVSIDFIMLLNILEAGSPLVLQCLALFGAKATTPGT